MPKPDMTAACNCGHPDPTSPIGHLLTCAVWDQQFGREPATPAPTEARTEGGEAGVCALPHWMSCDCNHIDGCQHPNAPAPDSLREQYAAAISAKVDGTEGCANRYRLADAVLAVRDTELQQLRERASLAQRIARSAARDAAGALTRQLVVEATVARIAALADEYPAGIDTALVLEALDPQEGEGPEKQEHPLLLTYALAGLDEPPNPDDALHYARVLAERGGRSLPDNAIAIIRQVPEGSRNYSIEITQPPAPRDR